jgi:hypothetical protein
LSSQSEFCAIANFPHHKHEGNESNVAPASPPDLQTVLAEIQKLMTAPTL